MPKSQELKNTDVIKTIMMVFVVIYHGCALWNRGGWFNQPPSVSSPFYTYLSSWLSSFHTYTFVLVSGYLFYYVKYEKKSYSNSKYVYKRRFERLMIPYFIVSLFWTIPFHIYYYGFNIVEICKKYFLMTGPDQLWFLVMIFFLWCIFYWLSDFLNHIKLPGGLLLIIGMLLWPLINYYIKIPSIFQITSVIRHFPFFYLGFLIRKYDISRFYNITTCIIFSILSIALFIGDTIITDYGFVQLYKIIDPIMQIITAFTMFILISVIAYQLDLCKLFESNVLLKNLKKYNFIIYLFHQQFIYISITAFNGKVPNNALFVLNVCIAFLGGALVCVMISKNTRLSNIFGV